MREYLERAHAAFPHLTVDDAAFAAHVARHDAAASLDHAGDLLLAFACGAGDPRALAELDRLYLAPLAGPGGALARLRDRVAPEEVVQTLRARVLVRDGDAPPRILDYAGKGPLGGWLRVAAVRTALNLTRGHRADAPADGDVDVEGAALATPLDPELEHLRERHAPAFRAAFEAALRGLPSEERTLLRLHTVDGLSIDEIGALYRVHRATAARRVQRARERVEAATRERLLAELRVTGTELDSLVAVLRSQLDVSIARLLETQSET